MSNVFNKLTIDLDILAELEELVSSISNWKDESDRTFIQHPVPEYIYKKSKVFSALEPIIVPGHLVILKMHENSLCYPHTDLYRRSTLNCLLSEEDNSSLLFFTNKIRHQNFNFEEHVYNKHSLYLLDVSIPHMVINRGKTRYLLSVSLKWSFKKSKDFLIDQKYL